MLQNFLKNFSQHRILGGAFVLAITQLAASVAGLLRDRALTKTFPDLDIVDVYISSFRPSDLLFQACIMSGFSVALVPLLAKHKAHDQREDLDTFLSGIIGIAALVFGSIALVLAIIFPWVAPYLVQFDGSSLELYIQYGRLALLTNFLFVFGNAFGQYLITEQRYWMYGVTPILYSVGTICGTLFLSDPELYGAMGPMIGSLLGAIAYLALRLSAVLHHGFRPRWTLWHTDIPEMFWLMLPRMAALGALQLQLLLFDTVGSGLEPGSITINAYARNFQSVAVGIAGIALAQSAFSLLSQAAAKGETDRFYVYLKKGIGILLFLTIPGAITLYFLSPVAAYLVHLTPRLSVFSICLGLYCISIPFESINHLLLRSYYSLKNTITPAIFSVLNGFSAIAISYYLAPIYGVFALAIAFSCGQLLQLIGLSSLLRKNVQSRI